jgi:Rrf2 family transcriptional regulator, cysteine metabolism repressor
MKLSTKGRYGARAMLDLALHYNMDNTPVALGGIADRQGISEEYLEQIFSALRKSGIVESVRGAQGGYKLGHSADKITIGDILRVLEGSLAPVDCVVEGKTPACERYDECVINGVWLKMRDAINQTVDTVTLEDLVLEVRSRQHDKEFMYFI